MVIKLLTMKRLQILGVLLLLLAPITAQDMILHLWPAGAPTENGLSGPEVDEGNNRVSNISDPVMYVYLADKEVNTGAAVILLPGGGYRREAMSHEGYEVAEWLKSRGITGIVLKYRLPNGHPEVPLDDACRAIRLTRFNAAGWGIDTAKIGIGGASAGGHLASTAGTRYNTVNLLSNDPVDQISSRPDFMLLLYPFIFFEEGKIHPGLAKLFFGDDISWDRVSNYSSDLHVDEYTPPAFMVLADNDRSVPPIHSISFYKELKKNSIPAELHIFQDGGHGFGITKKNLPVDQWPDLFIEWLNTLEFIDVINKPE